MSGKRVFRFDYGTLGAVQRTGSGAVRVPANLTRPGVFVYQTPNGPRREYRPPEEVFSPESMASAHGVPVTIDHPCEQRVDTNNVSRLNHGFVVDGVSEVDGYVAGMLQLNTSDVQTGVDSNKLSEVSMGYSADLEETPGTSEFGDYDVIQRNIRYNHAALGGTGWGRMGSEVRIRLDSNDNAIPPGSTNKEKKMKIRIDNMEFEEGSPEHIAYLNAKIAELQKALDEKSGALDTTTTAKDEALAKVAASEDPEKVDEKVEERIDTINVARSIIGDAFDHKNKSNKAIMIEVLTHVDSNFRSDSKMSLDYIKGAFNIARKGVKREDTWTKDRIQPKPEVKPTPRADAKPPAWQRPMAHSKK